MMSSDKRLPKRETVLVFLILQGQVYSQQSVLAEQVALSFTYGPGAFDEEGNFKNANVSRKIFALLANTLAGHPPERGRAGFT